jgi:polyisoprenoid-binding protein YceI
LLTVRGMGRVAFLKVCAVGFLVFVAGGVLEEVLPGAPLDNFARYVIPLGAIAIVIIAASLPLLATAKRPLVPSSVAGLVLALTVGLSLSGQGDAPSGKLSLADLRGLPTAAPAPTATAMPPAVPTTQAPTPPQSSGASVAAPAATATATVAVTPAQKPDYIVTAGKGTYTVREKLAILPNPNDAVGSTTVFAGEINLDGRPSMITADLRRLTSDQRQRDQYIQGQTLLTRTYPFAEFTVTDVNEYAKRLVSGEAVSGKLTGTMRIRGVEKAFTFDLKEARLNNGVIQLLATVDFTWADFNIPPPNTPSVRVEDNVHLEVVIEARRPA